LLRKYIDLILFRAAAELRNEGTRTYAGYLWWILEPLISLAVYYVVFKYILNHHTDHFVILLFTGIVIYRFFAGTVSRSAISIITGRGLMQLVYIHKTVFPLSILLVNLAKFLITFCLAVVACWFYGFLPSWAYLAIPVLILLMLVFTAGVSMICAAITPFFPDFQMILTTFLHLLFFISGIFYDIGALSPNLQTLSRLNPIAAVIEQFRLILIHRQWPVLESLVPFFFLSVFFFMIGWLLIHRFNRYFPKLN